MLCCIFALYWNHVKENEVYISLIIISHEMYITS